MMLFRGWRYRLKEERFVGKTITQALGNKPPEVDREKWNWLVNHWADPNQQRISEKNRNNRLAQKIKPLNGAKSTARIYHDEILPVYAQPKESIKDPTQQQTQQAEHYPPYVRLWEKTKRHKDGRWDPEGEAKYEEFKKLHDNQIEKHGADNLSLKEAYFEILKEKNGYHRGLALGPMPPRKGRNGGESNQIRVELSASAKIQQLQHKEAALQGEVQVLKSANLELKADMERIQKEAVDRENKWKEEAIEREKVIRDEMFDLIKIYIEGSVA